MIEFLPPREDAFGQRDAADFVGFDGADDADWGDEPPRSRWLTALAVLGVTGLLAGGVVAASPWDDPSSAPAPSTTVPTTTIVQPPRTTLAPTEPTLPRYAPTEPAGWVPIDSSSYQVVWAASSGDDVALSPSGGQGFALFVGDGPVGRTTGQWIAINASQPGFAYQSLRRDAVATMAGDRPALVTTAADGVVTVDARLFDGSNSAPLTVTGFGVGLDVLLAVAATAQLDWTGNVKELDLAGLDAEGGPLTGLRRVPTGAIEIWPFNDDLDPPMAWTDVVSSNGRRWASVRLVRPDAARDTVAALLLTAPVRPDELSTEEQVRLDDLARRGMPVSLSRGVGSGALLARVELAPDLRLTVTTDGSVLDLLGIVADLRPADPDEWVELLVAANNDQLDYPQSSATPSFTPFGSGVSWSAEVVDGRFSLSASDTGTWERFEFAQGPSLVEYRAFDRLFLRLTTTFPSEARSVTVVQDGTDPQTVKLHEVSSTGVLGAVVDLDPALPYSVTWFDADGASVVGPPGPGGAQVGAVP